MIEDKDLVEIYLKKHDITIKDLKVKLADDDPNNTKRESLEILDNYSISEQYKAMANFIRFYEMKYE